jgi:DNA repair exonuclease SbcCD nuclease subunit
MHDLYKAQFDKLIEEVKQHSIQWTADGIRWDEIRIVIAGDIAHQKINISNEQLLLTSWFLNQLSGYGKVVIIPGNHDFLENNHERLDSITPVVELLNNKTSGRRTNPGDQKEWYPTDLSMDRVPGLANSNFNFGAPQ